MVADVGTAEIIIAAASQPKSSAIAGILKADRMTTVFMIR